MTGPAPSSPRLQRFIAALHRRLLVVRLTEGAGLGALLGAALCLLAMPAMLWRGASAWPAAWLVPAGGLLGLAWAIVRRPPRRRAAEAADRQLGLDDLLATAWAVRSATPANGPMAGAVLAAAESTCAGLSTASVNVRRLGRRTWGTIGVALAAVMTLGLLSSNPVADGADATAPAASARHGQGAGDPAARRSASDDWRRRTAIAADFPGGEEERGMEAAMAIDEGPERGSGNDGGANDSGDATARGAGAGAGRTDDPGSADRRRPPTAGTDAARAGGTDVAGGTGGAGQRGSDGASASGTGGTPAARRPAPAWASSGWPAAREAARASLRSGRVAPEYHDLVRAYFER